jgi:hypothetical protein
MSLDDEYDNPLLMPYKSQAPKTSDTVTRYPSAPVKSQYRTPLRKSKRTIKKEIEHEEVITEEGSSTTVKRNRPSRPRATATFSGVNKKDIELIDKKLIHLLTEHPDDMEPIMFDHFSMVLNFSNHPLWRSTGFADWNEMWFIPYQDITDPSPNIIPEIVSQVSGISGLILQSIENHYEFIRNDKTILYPVCQFTVNRIVWTNIYTKVFDLLRLVYSSDDIAVDLKINQLQDKTLSDFNLPENLLLTPIPNEPTPNEPPYHSAITALQGITQLQTVEEKLSLLMTMKQNIIDSINNYWQKKNSKTKFKLRSEKNVNITLSADELVPLITYVVLKAKIPHVYVEMKFIESFIDERKVIGEEGWLLATFNSALNFLLNFDENDGH